MFFIIGLCCTDMDDNISAFVLILLFLIIGGLLIAISLKLENKAHSVDILYIQTLYKNENNVNYSKEFEKLYKDIILYKVNNIIKEGEKT